MKLTPDDPKLTAYALGELSESERQAVETELRQSPACCQAVTDIRQMATRLEHELAEEVCPALSPAEAGQVLSMLTRRRGWMARLGMVVPHWRWQRQVAWGAAAATVVILVAVSRPRWLSPREPAPTAGSPTDSKLAVPSLAANSDDLRLAQPSATPPPKSGDAQLDNSPPANAGVVAASDAATASHRPAQQKGLSDELAPLPFRLPQPSFKGTPPDDMPKGPHIEPWVENPKRPTLLVASGVSNLALGRKVTSSDRNPVAGTLDLITDGSKEALDDEVVELHRGTQWVQIDLERPCRIAAILFWHDHRYVVLFRDVVVQLADDADFTQNVRTLFNNDYDNSSGLGVGTHKEYFETRHGKLVDAQGAVARYVRLYSRGRHDDAINAYAEIEVYGQPAADESSSAIVNP